MDNQEKVIAGLSHCLPDNLDFGCQQCPYNDEHLAYRECQYALKHDALDLLKALVPRVMTLEEVKGYLDDPDGDKAPIWLEWSTVPALSGYVRASTVRDLMDRYLGVYNINYRMWNTRPTDDQRKAAAWDGD